MAALKALERSFIAIEQGNFRIPLRHCEGAKRPKQSLGILVFWGLGGFF